MTLVAPAALNIFATSDMVITSPGRNSLSCLAYPRYGITAMTWDEYFFAFETSESAWIRLESTGGYVDCTTTTFPFGFPEIVILLSPSEKIRNSDFRYFAFS